MFSLMRKGPRMTSQRSHSPLMEEDGKAPPVNDKAPPDGEALSPRDDGPGTDPGVEVAEPSEMPLDQPQQQLFEGIGDASAWQHPAGDEPPGMEATFLQLR